MKAVCVRKCFFNNVLYYEGQADIDFPDGMELPHHFAPMEPTKENSSRIEEVIDSSNSSDSVLIEKLRKELTDLGRPIDKRWGVEKLNIEIDKAILARK